jgi:hypothetical protein
VRFDPRLPIGLLFLVYGAILTIYGLVVSEATRGFTFGVNLNLLWGCALLIFGGTMFAFAMIAVRKGANS